MKNYDEIKKIFDVIDNSNLKSMKIFDEKFNEIQKLIQKSNISDCKMKKIDEWFENQLPLFRLHYERNLNLPGTTDKIKNDFLCILNDQD